MKESGRTISTGSARHRMRNLLVIGELAIAVLLLTGAGLLIKAYYELRSVPPGFVSEKLLTIHIDLPETRYEEVSQQENFRKRLLDALNSRPNVKAALISELPLSGEALDHNFVIFGRPELEPGTEPSLYNRSMSGEYLQTMQIPLILGRYFSEQDNRNAPLVGIVNQSMVKEYFQDRNPLGAQIYWAADEERKLITIIGVAGDVKHFGLDASEEPSIYTPYEQTNYWKRWMNLVIRSEIPMAALVELAKTEIRKLDPQLPITNVRTMSDVAAVSTEEREFNMLLLGIFAVIALILAAVGLYGVISYSVAQRTHEIGIRMALGAEAAHVKKLVVRQGMVLTLIGVTIGLIAAFALTRLMAGLLFGVSTRDPLTFCAVALLLSSVALLASYIPAFRATRVNPIQALRYE